MRCHSIRSVLRASFVAGLIASCQNAALSASWKDCQHPFAATCFIHDLQSEQFNCPPSRPEVSSNPILTSECEIIQTSDRDTVLSVAAAEQFEFIIQADAVFAALRSKTNQFVELGAMLFQSYSRSRWTLISSIDSQSLKLVEWIKVANSFPPLVVEPQCNQDFECGLDCGEWNRHVPSPISNILPYRGCANVFVYSLDTSTESLDSDSTPVTFDALSENDETPNGSDQFNTENGLFSDAEQAKQVGVDLDRPPTLEAEYETQAADISIESVENVNLVRDSNSHRLAVDYAMKVISPSSADTRSQMSKGVASQIRTLGQFLVDFANQIEDQIEQVEIARRDCIQGVAKQ